MADELYGRLHIRRRSLEARDTFVTTPVLKHGYMPVSRDRNFDAVSDLDVAFVLRRQAGRKRSPPPSVHQSTSDLGDFTDFSSDADSEDADASSAADASNADPRTADDLESDDVAPAGDDTRLRAFSNSRGTRLGEQSRRS